MLENLPVINFEWKENASKFSEKFIKKFMMNIVTKDKYLK